MNPDAPRSSPGVRYPPPLIYVAGFGAGWALHRWRPLPIGADDSSLLLGLTAATGVIWIVLMFSAFALFFRKHTAILPHRPAATLVTSGPYRFTRNPMYLGLAALYVGLSLLMNSWWPLVLLPLVVLVLQRLVIVREEQYLNDAFPGEYELYRKRVRRWL